MLYIAVYGINGVISCNLHVYMRILDTSMCYRSDHCAIVKFMAIVSKFSQTAHFCVHINKHILTEQSLYSEGGSMHKVGGGGIFFSLLISCPTAPPIHLLFASYALPLLCMHKINILGLEGKTEGTTETNHYTKT